MATFQKVLTAKEWGAILEFNEKVKVETGSTIIDVDALNVIRRAYLENYENNKAIKAEVIPHIPS